MNLQESNTKPLPSLLPDGAAAYPGPALTISQERNSASPEPKMKSTVPSMRQRRKTEEVILRGIRCLGP